MRTDSVRSSVPVLVQVQQEVDEQERVDRPLEALLPKLRVHCGQHTPWPRPAESRDTAVQISRKRLEETFAMLNTDELMARHASGDLTELANEVAEEEMRRRGIAPPARIGSGEPTEAGATDLSVDPLTTLATFLTATEAYVLRGLLAAEGIRAVVA